MSNPQIQVDVKLNDADYQRGASNIQKSAKQMATDFQKLGREISQVSQTMVFFGGAVTAAIGGAFSKASKDLPVVDQQLKSISNSFQALADNVAIAATPSLEAFAKLVNGMVYSVSKFVAEHKAFVNQFIQYSAIALAVGTLGFALGKLFSTISNLIKLGGALITVLSGMSLATLKMTAVVLAAVAALIVLDKAMGGYWADQFDKTIKKLGKTFQTFINDFRVGTETETKRATDLWSQFAQGFKDNLNTMAVNVKNFGSAVSNSMEKAFGDTIFNTIKGNFKDLKSVITSFADDVLRAFSRMAANQLLSYLFGNKEGGHGMFGSMFGLFGSKNVVQSGTDPAQKAHRHLENLTEEFKSTTKNMQQFQIAKDILMGGFVGLGNVIKGTGQYLVEMAGGLGKAWAAMTQGINVGFSAVINNLFQASQRVLALLGSASKGGGWLSWLGVAAGIAGSLVTGGASLIGSLGSMFAAGALPAGAGITMAVPTMLAEGGVVTRPTLALIGEAGPEAVTPLKGKGMGVTNQYFYGNFDVSTPNNMKKFVRMLKEELAR